MNKTDMKKGMLIKKEDETGISLYRILELTEKILVIDCDKKIMPVWKEYEEFTDCEEVKQENSSDVLTALENMDAEDRKTASII